MIIKVWESYLKIKGCSTKPDGDRQRLNRRPHNLVELILKLESVITELGNCSYKLNKVLLGIG